MAVARVPYSWHAPLRAACPCATARRPKGCVVFTGQPGKPARKHPADINMLW
ncbi:hypothetical protein SXCC_02315 [Gluconacetobacter sp. SXCC-1]|nr:hypothetical protein SXCC_02315 [Gluconacetobacter sp. SXCC-1]